MTGLNLTGSTVDWLMSRIERLNDDRVIFVSSLKRRTERGLGLIRVEREIVALDAQITELSMELMKRPRSLSRHVRGRRNAN